MQVAHRRSFDAVAVRATELVPEAQRLVRAILFVVSQYAVPNAVADAVRRYAHIGFAAEKFAYGTFQGLVTRHVVRSKTHAEGARAHVTLIARKADVATVAVIDVARM